MTAIYQNIQQRQAFDRDQHGTSLLSLQWQQTFLSYNRRNKSIEYVRYSLFETNNENVLLESIHSLIHTSWYNTIPSNNSLAKPFFSNFLVVVDAWFEIVVENYLKGLVVV